MRRQILKKIKKSHNLTSSFFPCLNDMMRFFLNSIVRYILNESIDSTDAQRKRPDAIIIATKIPHAMHVVKEVIVMNPVKVNKKMR